MTLLERLGGPDTIRAGIAAEFRALNRTPHPSRHERSAVRVLTARLAELGLAPVRDGHGNVMADVPAAPGRTAAPRLILQGHLDMVCAVAPGSGFDPLAEPVTVMEADGFLRSDGRSSLGADNNLGNAAVLWLLGRGLSHGPLRLLFTAAEEVGLEGAKQVDPSWLAGADFLLNTDGFHLGRAIVGSAGGRRETYRLPLAACPAPAGDAWRIALSGGAGGHSGDDIHRGRANALRLLAGFLLARPDWAVADFRGGTAHNAIPAAAEALVVLPEGGEPDLEDLAREAAAYGARDPRLTLFHAPAPRPEQVWSPLCRQAALALTAGLFHGVYAMDPAFPDVVGASANVGRLSAEDGQIQVCAFLRSARPSWEAELARAHDALAGTLGFSAEASGYPGWTGDPANPLAAVLARVYREQTGRTLEVSTVHVGLEPSVLGPKAPGLVMASTGPDILDAHSVSERAPLDTLPDYALLLAGTLEAL